jgi:hypothetical protein
MLEKEQSDLQFIVNDSPDPPRLVVMPKAQLRQLTTYAPLALVATTLLLLAIGWWWGPRSRTALPQALDGSAERIRALEQEASALKASLQQMQTKIASAGRAGTESWLGPIRRPFASQDLTAKKLLRLEDLRVVAQGDNTAIRFNLVSNQGESEKVSGHLFIVQYRAGGMGLYPVAPAEAFAQGVRFDIGETFAVSRLRPVEATFPTYPGARHVFLAFSREGDLLVNQEISPTEGP